MDYSEGSHRPYMSERRLSSEHVHPARSCPNAKARDALVPAFHLATHPNSKEPLWTPPQKPCTQELKAVFGLGDLHLWELRFIAM